MRDLEPTPLIASDSSTIRLRPLRSEDLHPLHELLSDWAVMRHTLLPHCKTLAQSRKYLNGLMNDPPSPNWQFVPKVIENFHLHHVIGLCGISIFRRSRHGQVWYLLRPDHWGRGIGQQAARELLRMGFGVMKLDCMYGTCLSVNPASARILEKIGMLKELDATKTITLHGLQHLCYSFSLRRAEWQSVVRQKTQTCAIGAA